MFKKSNAKCISILRVKELFEKSNDIVFRVINVNDKVKIQLVFVDGLIDQSKLSEFVLQPLSVSERIINVSSDKELVKKIREGYIYFPGIKESNDFEEITTDLLLGSAVIIIESLGIAFLFDVKGFDKRAVSQPTEEISLKGSKEGFVETIRVNTAIVRRKLRTSDLVIEHTTVGSVSKTIICVVYIKGLVENKLVEEIIRRLNSIETEQVMFTNVIEQELIDHRNTPFPQVESTEKPTKFCSSLLEGRVGIMIDGIPFTMIIPTSVVNFFQTPDDYDFNYIVMSVIRLLRYGLAIMALILPAFYVAVTGFHPQIIPEKLVLAISVNEAAIPIPIYLECFLMLIAFQTLMEAGARIWSSIGSMVSLVGALIVGEAAIGANYVSPGVLVVVAAASIANFTIPNKDFAFALWLWGFIVLILSSIIGLYGLVIGLLLLLHHLCQIEILGEPYLLPFVSSDGKNLWDTLITSKDAFKKKKTVTEQIKKL